MEKIAELVVDKIPGWKHPLSEIVKVEYVEDSPVQEEAQTAEPAPPEELESGGKRMDEEKM